MEREDKDNENSSKGNDNFFDFDFLTKFLRPLKTLFDLQFRILKLEFKRESGRFVEGVLSLISGCFFSRYFLAFVKRTSYRGVIRFFKFKIILLYTRRLRRQFVIFNTLFYGGQI